MMQFRLRTLWVLAFLLGLMALGYFVSTVSSTAAAPSAQPQLAGPPDFGSNTIILDPSMTITQVRAAINIIPSTQITNEMGTARYALLFKPGTYGTSSQPLNFQVGFYTEVAGLGQSPNDVVINGSINVYNQCDGSGNCIALDNFWRSLSNLTINVYDPSGAGCYSGEFWAVSQAASLRRLNVNNNGKNFTFMDYCTGPSYASGGFMADSKTNASVVNGSQQQFFVRDSQVGGWSNGVWNQVFAGVIGAPAQNFQTTQGITLTGNPYTTLATNPASREKPFLTYDSVGQSYGVFVPNPRTNSSGTTWALNTSPGITLPISTFFVAKPTDSASTMNAALASGQNLLLTPGIYQLDQTLQVTHADAVVLGLGLATLVPNGGITALNVGDVAGVKIAGVMFDAGTVNSPVLLKVGSGHGFGISSDPTTISDVFLRIGGATLGKTTTAMIINSDYTILDDIWAWRADHGNEGTVGWTLNTSDTGVIVNGDNVTATGLFVEHFQKYQTIWNGENGKTIFYQSEMPYDPPNQAAYTHDGVLGYASYKVADNVQNHEAWGVGVYCFFNVDPTIHNAHAFEVPYHPGVKFHDLVMVALSDDGYIDHIINISGPATPHTGTTAVGFVLFQPLNSLTASGSPNPSNNGQMVTLTATTVPITATGTVTFTTGVSTTLGAGSLVSGTTSITTTALPVGLNLITATYGGDNTYAAEPVTFTQLVCPTSLSVIFNMDDGTGNTCGTLSFALKQIVTGTDPITVTFALQAGNTITFTGGLASSIKVQPYVVLSGGTFGSTDRIIINGNSVASDGLVLMGYNKLENITIEHFGGREIVTQGTGNILQGVIVVS